MRYFVNVGTSETPKWAKVGRGFTVFRETSRPRIYKRRYITDAADTETVLGYSHAIEYEFDVYENDAAIRAIRRIADGEFAHGDALLEILSVEAFDGVGTGAYRACRRKFTLTSRERGSEESLLVYKGVLESAGEGEFGKFYVASGTFEADRGVVK